MITSDLLKSTLTKQRAQQEYLPKISRHVAENIVHFEDGRLGFVIKLDGIPFEGVNDNHLISSFNTLKNLFATVGKQFGNKLGIWTTIQRKKIDLKREYRFKNTFCQQFSEHYIERFNQANYYENLFYITVCLKYDDFDDGLEDAHDLLEIIAKSLNSYDPHLLGTYTNEFDICFSEIYQFFGTLINGGIREDIPLSASAAYTVIGAADLHFGTDVLEIRNTEGRKFATCYDMKEFGLSKVGVLINTLSLPCEYTLTQSFVYTNNADMQTEIDRQAGALRGAGDQATDQQDEMRIGKGELSAGRMMFGDFSGSLVVYGDTAKQARQNGSTVFTAFLTSGGFRFVPAGLSMPSTFFSQVAGYNLRPRIIPKTTTNLATVFGMHNYSQGKSWGNPIGDGSPLMPLKTLSNTLFNLSLHYSRLDQDNLGEQVTGHTLILGATGTGKTTVETAVLAFMERFGPYLFVLDLDRGMEIFIRALGGTYFAIEEGKSSGLNPFQLPDTGANRMFLYRLVKTCAGSANAEEEKQIKMAVDTLYEIDFSSRNFSTLLENLPYSLDENALRTRLSKWCRSEDGQYAWCLDNDSNDFSPDDFYRIGLDVTSILRRDYEPTAPVLAYLFYLKDLMGKRVAAEGGILASVVAEFWYAGQFGITQDLLLKTLKTGRKLGELMILDSQSPEDAINCPIFPAIVQQTPTKIFLPNPDADYESYMRCGLSEKEYSSLVVKDITSRVMLIKQSKQSVFTVMDLYGFDDELAVLSGTAENVEILHRTMKEVGSEEPDVWLPVFIKTVVEQRAQKRNATV